MNKEQIARVFGFDPIETALMSRPLQEVLRSILEAERATVKPGRRELSDSDR